jgi:hypothetical protein
MEVAHSGIFIFLLQYCIIYFPVRPVDVVVAGRVLIKVKKSKAIPVTGRGGL